MAPFWTLYGGRTESLDQASGLGFSFSFFSCWFVEGYAPVHCKRNLPGHLSAHWPPLPKPSSPVLQDPSTNSPLLKRTRVLPNPSVPSHPHRWLYEHHPAPPDSDRGGSTCHPGHHGVICSIWELLFNLSTKIKAQPGNIDQHVGESVPQQIWPG